MVCHFNCNKIFRVVSAIKNSVLILSIMNPILLLTLLNLLHPLPPLQWEIQQRQEKREKMSSPLTCILRFCSTGKNLFQASYWLKSIVNNHLAALPQLTLAINKFCSVEYLSIHLKCTLIPKATYN